MPLLLDGVALEPAPNQADGSHPHEPGAEMIADRGGRRSPRRSGGPPPGADRRRRHTPTAVRHRQRARTERRARLKSGGRVESYHVAIIRTDGLTAGWRADYAERDAAVDDLRRYATWAASERRKRKSRCRRTARRSTSSSRPLIVRPSRPGGDRPGTPPVGGWEVPTTFDKAASQLTTETFTWTPRRGSRSAGAPNSWRQSQAAESAMEIASRIRATWSSIPASTTRSSSPLNATTRQAGV